jgi:hypothetical protein
VEVRIPLASIPEGGFVGYSIDGKFRLAIAPTEAQRKVKVDPANPPMFVYTWDTKAPFKSGNQPIQLPATDGAHTITATLYTPAGTGSSKVAQVSAVKVNVANKIVGDPGNIALRYKFKDATQRTYNRAGETVVVAGLSQGRGGGTGDQELIGQKSELLLSVEDVYPTGNAMVRNKLTKLQVRSAQGQTNYPIEALPNSLYQELNPVGGVQYENQSVSFDELSLQGIPISATIDLPKLPVDPKKVGSSWDSPGVVIDVPGVPRKEMPRVTVRSTFESVEWEGLYPTAKIHQTYKGPAGKRVLQVGSIPIENASISFERDIYIAYEFGTLVKVDRKIEITGKTTAVVDPFAGGAPGMGGGGGLMPPGGMSSPGGMSAPGGMAPPGMFGGMGSGGVRGGGGGAARRGGGGGGASGGGRMGGMMPPGGMMGPPGGMRMGGTSGGGRMGGMMPPGGMMGGGVPGMGGGMGAETTQQITLRSTEVTELRRPTTAKTKVATK